MKITLYSKSKERAKLISMASEFFLDYLNIRSSRYDLYILSKQSLRTQNNGILGLAAKLENHIVIALDNKLSFPNLLQVLAHEMVHVKQFAKGQFSSKETRNGNQNQYWLGKKVKRIYKNRPWEIEAYRREMELVEAFFEYFSKNKRKLLT